jgi:hypothetical protein
VHVYTAEGQQSNVGHFKTFHVLIPDKDELEEASMNPETMRRFAELSVERMQGLGYQPIEAEEADLILAFSPSLRMAKNVRKYTPSGSTADSQDSRGMAEGTLAVSFVDVKAKAIVLKRVAQARVDLGVSDKDMHAAVAGIFEDVPRAAAQ